MGQQQLLLVILVTIIVGIATVVAINTFGSAADSANVDAVRQDLAQMAASAQGYYMRPGAMGGGGQTFTGITFNNMGAVACKQTTSGSGASSTTNDTECSNENGEYTITAGSDTKTFSIEGVPATAGGNIAISVCANDSKVSAYDPDGGASAPGC